MTTWIVEMTEQHIQGDREVPAPNAEVLTLRVEADDRQTAEHLARITYREAQQHEGIVLSSRDLPAAGDAE